MSRAASVSVALFLIFGTALAASPTVAKEYRSAAARCHFLKSHGYPDCRTPKGFIVDHVIPLCRGGPDIPANMQLQTVADAKMKDRGERISCRVHRGR